MHSPENNIEIQETPNLDSVLQKSNESIEKGRELLIEGIPQVEAFTERNPKAIQAFLEKYLKTETV